MKFSNRHSTLSRNSASAQLCHNVAPIKFSAITTLSINSKQTSIFSNKTTAKNQIRQEDKVNSTWSIGKKQILIANTEQFTLPIHFPECTTFNYKIIQHPDDNTSTFCWLTHLNHTSDAFSFQLTRTEKTTQTLLTPNFKNCYYEMLPGL